MHRYSRYHAAKMQCSQTPSQSKTIIMQCIRSQKHENAVQKPRKRNAQKQKKAN
jgi:hypothetical protein